MHELAITENLFEIIFEQIKKHQVKKILKVKVKVGELTAVIPDCLQFCFDTLKEGTILKEASLDIEMVPLKAKCKKCKKDFPVKEFHFICPFCKGKEIEIISGRELFIENLEVE